MKTAAASDASKTIDCSRCGGTGRLPQFSNVIGGTCFKCHGSGRSASSKRDTTIVRFVASARELASGERVTVFELNAKSADQALKMARVRLAGGNGYDASTASVEPK